MEAKQNKSKVYAKLMAVQTKLRAPKDCRNNFGGYNYRKAEDILEAVKPLIGEVGAIVRIDDTVEQIGDRYYVRATAAFVNVEDGESVTTCAFAREPLTRKGMDEAQVTGATSSYARKYALCGLFAIDDSSADPDTADNRENAAMNGGAQNGAAAVDAGVCPCGSVKGKKWSEIDTATLKKVLAVPAEKVKALTAAHRNAIVAELGRRENAEVVNAEVVEG